MNRNRKYEEILDEDLLNPAQKVASGILHAVRHTLRRSSALGGLLRFRHVSPPFLALA